MMYTSAADVREVMRATYVCDRCCDIVEVTHPGEGLRHGRRAYLPRQKRCRGLLFPFYGRATMALIA